MQPIERYGLVALLFLVVTVVAVVLWDRKNDKDKNKAKEPPAITQVQSAPGGEPAANAAPQQPAAGASNTLNGWSAPAAQSGSEVIDPNAQQQPAAAPAAPAGGNAQPYSPLANDEQFAAAPAQPLGGGAIDRAPTSGRSTTVKKGDTLSSIAKRELGSANRHGEILALNPGVDPNRLRVGQTLKLPGKSSNLAKSSSAATPAAIKSSGAAPAASGLSYTVKSGDSLWTIAQSQLGDGDRYSEIAALNPQVDSKKLNVGTRLRLPAGGARPVQRETVAAARPKKSGVR